MSHFPSDYPEELLHTAEQASLRLAEVGVPEDDARQIGWEIAEHLRTYWGGRMVYVREPQAIDSRQLDLLAGEAQATGLAAQELFADLAAQVAERLVAIALLPEEAQRIGWDVAQHLNAFWGGGQLYICKGLAYKISTRDHEIYRRFNGDNHEWLAYTYDLTVQHVYRIVKRIGEEERRKRQRGLFPDFESAAA